MTRSDVKDYYDLHLSKIKLFTTGFIQVIFVAANTVFISKYQLVGNLLTAFAISFVWTYNVKKVAFGETSDRWAYAIGASLGSVAGTVTANWFLG